MIRIFKIIIITFFTLFCFYPLNNFVKSATDVTITDIQVKNNQRIDSETIVSYLNLDKGDKVNYKILNKKLKELYDLGLFADIKFRVINNELIVIIKENPMINNIYYSGNKKIKEDDIKEAILLKSRNVYQKKDLTESLAIIRDLYKRSGYFSAKLGSEINKLSQNRVDLTIKIVEGPKTKIKGIKFIGNKVFSDRRLKSILSTKESKLWRILSAGDIYDPDRVSYDKELLRRYYLEEGYADFKIKSAVAEITKDKSGFFITFSVEEGKKYKFGNVKIVNRKKGDFDKKKLDEIIKPLPNKDYNIKLLDTVINEIKEYGGNLGFAFLEVRPNLKKNSNNNTIDVSINIGDTKKVYVNRIAIQGNNRTLDRVIRKEVRFNEGDSFNVDKLKRSEQRIRNTGFFETVETEQLPTKAKDRVDLNIKVAERKTGEFSIGGGFSSTNGATANVGIAEKNFLGKGQDMRLKFTVSERANQIDFGFTEPSLFGKDIASGVDIFKIKTTYADESSYDNDTSGGALRIGYMITERSRHSWNYTFKKEEIQGVKTGASEFVSNQKGNYTTSSIQHSLTYYNINDRLNPTKGSQWRLSNKLAGLGGSVSYLKSDLKYVFHYSLNEDYVLSTELIGGYIFGYNDDKVRLKDRYFLGGDSFPGFEPAGVGPRDTSSANKDALGGNIQYIGTTEFTTPIPGVAPQLGIKGVFFAAAGTVTEIDENGGDKIKDVSNPRLSVGFGVQWSSPFGPVRLDFARPIIKEDFDRIQFFKFNFGTRF